MVLVQRLQGGDDTLPWLGEVRGKRIDGRRVPMLHEVRENRMVE